MVLPVTKSPPMNLSTILLVQMRTSQTTGWTLPTPMTSIASQLSSRLDNIFNQSVLRIFPSDVESLKEGIIKTRNKTSPEHTVLLVGETGVGKSAVMEFIANVLIGKGIDHYDLDILDHLNEQGGSPNQSQTNSARFYKLTSQNGIVVCPSIFEHDERA